MKNILILLTLSLNLFGSCLTISSNSGITCNGDTVKMEDINLNFTTTMKVSDSGVTVLDIPIYVVSDSTEEITMTITNSSSLQNSANEVISTNLYYVVGSTESSITEGSSFTLLANGAGGRDGNTIIGYIRIKVVNLSDTQTVGSYSLQKNISINLNNNDSASGTLDSTGSVDYVTVVSFEDSSSYTSGEKFISATVDYGNLNANQVNSITKNVYVKNNTNKDCTISFETKSLENEIDNSYTIGMNYYYTKTNGTEETIPNNTPFTLISGKNGGTKAGEIKFETAPITSSIIAGNYKAVMSVTISAR